MLIRAPRVTREYVTICGKENMASLVFFILISYTVMFANKTEVICLQELEENSFLPLSSMTERNFLLQQNIF